MSKGEGRKIAIKFTEPLVGDVSGLTPTPVGGYAYSEIEESLATVTTLNQYSSNYSGAKIVDGSTSTYWRGTTAINWIKFQFAEAFALTKLRLYMASYYIKTFTISGSNDGSTWTQIGGTLTGASSSTAQWYEYTISNEIEYLYYKIDTLTTYGSTVYLYEVEMYETVGVGNEKFFTVSAQEYDYVPDGEISTVTYKVLSVSKDSEDDTILYLETDRFENAFGNVTVAYGGGNLSGDGGYVEAFSEVFTPADLIPKPDQDDNENIQISGITGTGTLTHIYYTNTADQKQGHLEISGITGTGTLTNINDL